MSCVQLHFCTVFIWHLKLDTTFLLLNAAEWNFQKPFYSFSKCVLPWKTLNWVKVWRHIPLIRKCCAVFERLYCWEFPVLFAPLRGTIYENVKQFEDTRSLCGKRTERHNCSASVCTEEVFSVQNAARSAIVERWNSEMLHFWRQYNVPLKGNSSALNTTGFPDGTYFNLTGYSSNLWEMSSPLCAATRFPRWLNALWVSYSMYVN